MGKLAGSILTALVLFAGCSAVYVYQSISEFEVVEVTDDVHVIHGLGSNVGILRTDRGSVVVDTMTFTSQGREIRERAEALAGPVQVLINTHWHLDHTHGNPAFPSGLPVVSTKKTLAYLEALDADYWKGDAAGTLPNDTFDEAHTVELGGKTVRLLHPGRGHTDGDLVALFVEDRVIHMGDLYFNGRYPNIDLEAGGSVQEWSASIDRVLDFETEFDHVIPGHGPVTDAEGLRQFQRFIEQLAATGRAGASLSLEEHQAQAKLDADAGYEDMVIPFILRLDREFVLRRAWEETTANFERHPVE